MIDDSLASTGQVKRGTPAWEQIVVKYPQPSAWRGVWQISNSLIHPSLT